MRERKEDILPLAEQFLSIYAVNKQGVLPVLSDAAKEYLLSHPWQGNVRELENSLQRAVILQNGEMLDRDDFEQLRA